MTTVPVPLAAPIRLDLSPVQDFFGPVDAYEIAAFAVARVLDALGISFEHMALADGGRTLVIE